MKNFLQLFIVFCPKASLLIERNHREPLPFFDHAKLTLHLKICTNCAEYKKQSLLIEDIMKYGARHFSNNLYYSLSENSKLLIQESVENNMKKN